MANQFLDPEFMAEMERRMAETEAAFDGDNLYDYGQSAGDPTLGGLFPGSGTSDGPMRQTLPAPAGDTPVDWDNLPTGPDPSTLQNLPASADGAVGPQMTPMGAATGAEWVGQQIADDPYPTQQEQLPQSQSSMDKVSYSETKPMFMKRGSSGMLYNDPTETPDLETSFELGSQARANQADTYRSMGRIQEEAQNLEADKTAEIAQQQRADTESAQIELAQNKQILEKQQANIDAMYAAIPKMQRGQIWSNTDNATKAVGALGAFINGYLNPSGPNSTINTMMKMVDQDMEAQQSNINTAKDQAGAAERGYTRTSQMLNEQFEQQQLLKVAKIASMRTDLEAQMLKTTSPLNKHKQELMAQGLAEKEAEELGKYRQAQFNNGRASMKQFNDTRKDELDIRHRNSMLAEQRRARQDANRAREASNQPGLGRAIFSLEGGRTIYGNPAMKFTETQMNDATKKPNYYRDLGRAMNSLAEVVRDKGRGIYPNEKAAIAAANNKIVEIKRVIAGANLPEDEAKRVLAPFGDAGSLMKSPDTTLKLLEKESHNNEKDARNFLELYGPREYVQLPDGRLAPKEVKFDELFGSEMMWEGQEKATKRTIGDQVVNLEGAVGKAVERYNTASGKLAKEAAAEPYYDAVRGLLDTASTYNWSKADLSDYRKEIEKLSNSVPPSMRKVPIVNEESGDISFIDPMEAIDALEVRDRSAQRRQQEGDPLNRATNYADRRAEMESESEEYRSPWSRLSAGEK